MNILVTGCNGQLGNCIKKYADLNTQYNYIFTDIDVSKELENMSKFDSYKRFRQNWKFKNLDITNYNDILQLLKEENVNMIINCAAYTNVDKAEDEPKLAYNVNMSAVDNLAKAAVEVGAKMIHISTDYVFDGKRYKPYNENNITNPIGVYGLSKCKGEEVMYDILGDNGIIIRTAWLYSNYGKNFVKTMIKLGREKDELKVVFDQVGTPTFAEDLVSVIFTIINSDKWVGGIYHYTNEGICSWYDFAATIMDLYKLNCKVLPVYSNEYLTKAKRPYYSVLDKTKIKKTYNIEIPYWQDSLKKCLSMSFVD